MDYLSNLPKSNNYKTSLKRVGRGIGSGKGGHTVGRGMNGQMSRSGAKLPKIGFSGGQSPITKRLPKNSGFKRGFDTTQKLTLRLSRLVGYKNEVTLDNLIKDGLIKCQRMDDANVKIVCDIDAFDTKLNITDPRIKATSSVAKLLK